MAQPTCGGCGRFPNHRPGSPVCVAQSRDEWRDRAERAEARVKELEEALRGALRVAAGVDPITETELLAAARAVLDQLIGGP